MFLKIIYNNLIIDILENPVFVRFIKSTNSFVITDIISADGVMSRDRSEVYLLHTIESAEYQNCKVVTYVEIQENEYLNMLVNIKQPITGDGNVIDIDELQQIMIDKANSICHQIILDGFDIVLSDGINYHFSLEITDQLKISKLNDRAMSGVQVLPWHCDNGLCKFYNAEDIMAINAKMEYLIEYHTTYFNSLKNYIKNIRDKDVLVNIEYGVEIPKQYQSEVLIALLAQMEQGEM